MPPANQSGFFHIEDPLNVVNIADIQVLRNGKTDLELLNELEYKGVLFVEVATKHDTGESAKEDSKRTSKRRRVEFRAIVLGQSQKEPGKMALFKLPLATFQVLVGTEMRLEGGISVGQVHWCSGLQLKWIPHTTPSTRVETGLFTEKKIQHGIVSLTKELYNLIADEEDWSDIPWDDARIDEVQRQRNVNSSPKKRQSTSSGKRSKTTTSTSSHRTNETEKETQKAAESRKIEDWSNARVKRCGFDINQSKTLDGGEKLRVTELMKSFREGEEADADEYTNHDLADLLNRAFTAPFDVQILVDYRKAALVNEDISSLPSFSRFADWWDRRDKGVLAPTPTPASTLTPALPCGPICSPSGGSAHIRSTSTDLETGPSNFWLERGKKLVASFFQRT